MTTSPHPHVDAAEKYAREVIEGAIPAGRYVHGACARYLRDRAAEANLDYPYHLDPAKAERVCRFVELLPHVDGGWAGRRELIRLEPWQCFIITAVFGSIRRADGRRRFSTAMVMIPRKNGKSALSSALALYMLCADGEHSAEVYCGATSQEQALVVFNVSRRMALATPALRTHYGIEVNARSLVVSRDGSRFTPVIGKPKDGSSPSCAILDEAHQHSGPELRDTMLGGMGARAIGGNPLLWTISTAGVDIGGSCYDDVLTGRSVLDQTIEADHRFYIEWGLDPGDDWTTETALVKANPNLGVSVSLPALLKEQADAIRNPRLAGIFRTKKCNEWISSSAGIFNVAAWNASYDPEATPESLEGRDCIVGVDLASTQDIAALTFLFRNEDDSYSTFARCYLPSARVNDPGNDHYRAWADQGYLIETDGDLTDIDRISDDLAEAATRYNIRHVVADPMGSFHFLGRIAGLGIETSTIHQSPKNLDAPLKYLAALVQAKKLRHCAGPNHPLTWQMSNVEVKAGFELQKPTKARAENKIDAAAAMINAMAIYRNTADESEYSHYQDNPFLFV